MQDSLVRVVAQVKETVRKAKPRSSERDCRAATPAWHSRAESRRPAQLPKPQRPVDQRRKRRQRHTSQEHVAEAKQPLATESSSVAEKGGLCGQPKRENTTRVVPTKSSKRIAGITSVIDSNLRSQPEILRLNAAVEAAARWRTRARVCGRSQRGAQPGATQRVCGQRIPNTDCGQRQTGRAGSALPDRAGETTAGAVVTRNQQVFAKWRRPSAWRPKQQTGAGVGRSGHGHDRHLGLTAPSKMPHWWSKWPRPCQKPSSRQADEIW